ncbi:MAG: hypothetical protein HY901_10890, partial [Deltaproteobacteria bacterium]|nr:hypothetical protein [Deltaproteobacteria bacterium]
MPGAAAKTRLGEILAVVVFSDRPRRLADWDLGAFEAREIVSGDGVIGLS